MSNILEDRTLQEIQTGVWWNAEQGCHTCLACGQTFEEGEVYPAEGRFFTAEHAAHRHAQNAHGSRLEQLLAFDSRYLSLTENQQTLMRLLAQGKTDAEIAAETGVTPATIRRQRFTFREKAKQAKLYLAIYSLANKAKRPQAEALVPIHEGVRQLDERFVITQKENDKYLKNAFESLEPLRLRALPVKEKRKIAVLNHICAQFQSGVDYSEKEVNAILKEIHPQEYVTLRRYLIEYGFLQRVADGSRYWKS